MLRAAFSAQPPLSLQSVHVQTIEHGPDLATPSVVDMAGVEHVFPSECPSCRVIEGMPYKALMTDEVTCVRLRCRLCRYEWDLEMPRGDVSVAPKGDRRKKRRD
jgi:hypothetical protein